MPQNIYTVCMFCWVALCSWRKHEPFIGHLKTIFHSTKRIPCATSKKFIQYQVLWEIWDTYEKSINNINLIYETINYIGSKKSEIISKLSIIMMTERIKRLMDNNTGSLDPTHIVHCTQKKRAMLYDAFMNFKEIWITMIKKSGTIMMTMVIPSDFNKCALHSSIIQRRHFIPTRR